MRDPRQRSVPVWTIRSVAVRSCDGPQRVAQVYRRLLAPPRCDTAGSAAVVKAGLTVYQNGEAILYQLFEYVRLPESSRSSRFER